MEVIDRYVQEVGRQLPRRLRADVQTELRSILEDKLDEHCKEAGRAPDAEMAAQIVKDFGPPQEVAMRYLPRNQYLIGPRLLPAYKLTVTIMVVLIAALFLAFFVVGLVGYTHGRPGAVDPRAVLDLAGRFLYTAFFNFGLVTLVFVLVERVQARREAERSAWTPALLPPVDDPDHISPFGMVVGLYLILAFAVLFNFYPEWVVAGIRFRGEEGVWKLSLLLPQFGMYMPYLNTFWALDFVLHLSVLREGRWRRPTRWAEFGLGLFGAAIIYVVITGPPVFEFDYIIKAILKGVFVIILINSGVRFYRLVTHRPTGPWQSSQTAPHTH